MSAIQQNAFEIAKKEIGVTEVQGPENNIRVIEYHMATSLQASQDSVPWCSSFVNWCITMANGKGTNSAMARSWLSWGSKIKTPVAGDLVIFSRGNNLNAGHVGFLASKPNALLPFVYVLGGNQHDEVCVSKMLKWNILGYRRCNQDT